MIIKTGHQMDNMVPASTFPPLSGHLRYYGKQTNNLHTVQKVFVPYCIYIKSCSFSYFKSKNMNDRKSPEKNWAPAWSLGVIRALLMRRWSYRSVKCARSWAAQCGRTKLNCCLRRVSNKFGRSTQVMGGRNLRKLLVAGELRLVASS